MSPWAICSGRFLVLAFLSFRLTLNKSPKYFARENWKYHLLSLLFLTRASLIIEGFRLTALAKPLALVFTWPLIFVILSAAFLKTRLSIVSLSCITIAAIGMSLVLGDPSLLEPGEQLAGYLCMLGGSLLTAVEMVLNRRLIERSGGLTTLFYSTFLGGVLLSPALTLTLFSQEATMTFGYFVILCFVFGTLCYYNALERSSPVSSAVLSYIEVPITTIVAVTCFGEAFSIRVAVGIAAILISALVISLDQLEGKNH